MSDNLYARWLAREKDVYNMVQHNRPPSTPPMTREALEEAEPPQATSLAGCLAHQRTLRADIKRLKEELHYTTAAGVIECAIRNPAVSEYMNHWEGRTLKAEATVAALTDENAPLKQKLADVRQACAQWKKEPRAYVGDGPHECALEVDAILNQPASGTAKTIQLARRREQ